MTLELWLLFLATTGLASLTPGPAVLTVLAVSLQAGAGRAVWTILGILAANIAYLVLAGLGFKAMLAASEDVFWS